MAKTHQFDSVPSPRLMRTIGATALDAPESVAEMVANCIDARLGDASVHVDVMVDDQRVSVLDDGSGMDLATLRSAIRLGVDMDQVVKRGRRRMGTYGLGMKTAAASLGDRWGIVTRPASEPGKEYRVTFDLKGFVSRGADSTDWSVEVIEDRPDADGPLEGRAHGTCVWVEDLRNRGLMAGAFVAHLGRAFGPYAIEHGDKITVNGVEATDDVPRFVEGSRHELAVLVNEELGWQATGWVALDSRTHNRGDYGLHLYRNGQLVETWNKDFFPAHLMTSRILGVLNLDYVPVNFNKKGFETSSEEWRFTVGSMKEALKPAVEASRTMSRGRGDESRVHRALTRMRQALGVGTTGLDASDDEAGTSATASADLNSEGFSLDFGPAHTQVLAAHQDRLELPRGVVRIVCDTDGLESETLPWDYIYASQDNELLVILNTESLVYAATKDVEFLACLAIADCIARVLIEREGIDSGRARRVRDQWLHEAFSQGFLPTQVGASARTRGESAS